MALADDVRIVLDRLAAEGISHMLVGGVAQEALGVPRTTFDVDLQVALPAPPSPAASIWLDMLVEERSRDPVFDQEVIIAHVALSSTPFEFFLTAHWLTRQALERRWMARSELLGREVPVPTVEDFILMKAAHMVSPTRSTRKSMQDGVDITQVVAAAERPLDGDYLKRNAERLGVWSALQPLLTP